MDWSAIVAGGIAGLGSGVIGSIVAPWINWGIEKKKLQLAARKKMIVEVRGWLLHRGDADHVDFRSTAAYSRIKHLLSNSLRKHIATEAFIIEVSSGGPAETQPYFVRKTLEEISDIERKWGIT